MNYTILVFSVQLLFPLHSISYIDEERLLKTSTLCYNSIYKMQWTSNKIPYPSGDIQLFYTKTSVRDKLASAVIVDVKILKYILY